MEERIAKAITAVVKRDAKLALEVVEGDEEIDQMEVDVEEDCLKILALTSLWRLTYALWWRCSKLTTISNAWPTMR